MCAYAKPTHGSTPRDDADARLGILLRALGFLSRLRLQIAQLLGVQGAGRAPPERIKWRWIASQLSARVGVGHASRIGLSFLIRSDSSDPT